MMWVELSGQVCLNDQSSVNYLIIMFGVIAL